MDSIRNEDIYEERGVKPVAQRITLIDKIKETCRKDGSLQNTCKSTGVNQLEGVRKL